MSISLNKLSNTKKNIKTREYRKKIKKRVIDHYGGKCKCCGEKELSFLTISHTNNNGAEHRRSLNPAKKNYGGQYVYIDIIKNNFPQNQYEVLCFNCNTGSYINRGICPHKTIQGVI